MPKDEDATALVGFQPRPLTEANVKQAVDFFSSADLEGWNKLPVATRQSFAKTAVALGLHPLTGEIMVYKGKLFITIDGRRRLAMRAPDFAAVQPDIVSDPTVRRSMGARWPGDILAKCVVYRKSTPMPTIQYGLVREAERYPSDREREQLGITPSKVQEARAAHDPDMIMDACTNPEAKVRPVITQPAIMAMKRAEARCLNIIAQAPLPTFDTELGTPVEEEANGDPEVIESTAREIPIEEEAPPDEAPVKEAAEPSTPTDVPTSEGPKAELAQRGRGGVLNPPETAQKLLQFAVQHLGFRNHAAVLTALGVKDITEVIDLVTAWNTLCDLQGK
jgi:hypothetical protein